MVNQDFDLSGVGDSDEATIPSEDTPLLGVQRRRSQRTASLQRPVRTLAPVLEEGDDADGSSAPSSSSSSSSSSFFNGFGVDARCTTPLLKGNEEDTADQSVQHSTPPRLDPAAWIWNLLSVIMCCAEPPEVRAQREAEADTLLFS
jgi:hypothetical protein